MKPKNLSALKREKERIEQEGFLQGCRIVPYRPGSVAPGTHVYYQLRSTDLLDNGKRTRHLKTEDIGRYRQLIANGKKLRQLERHIAYLESGKQSARSIMTSSASDEWYTPPGYIELARQVLGRIDLDPASNHVAQQWIQATTYYTLCDNGLEQAWEGRMWLNPPYGSQVHRWTAKAVQSYRYGAVCGAILLVRPAPGSAWYQKLSGLYPCCIPHKRIRFMDANGVEQKSPVHGNAFFYLGKELERFLEVFASIGVVMRPCT